MSNYRRAVQPGGVFFFTVVTKKRKAVFNNEKTIATLREAFRRELVRRPFDLEAIVVLPDHLHCLWQLPEHDSDFSNRWREIKKFTTRELTHARYLRGDDGLWQRRFWEHQIRDDKDWRTHMDYIHYNPVKHGYVTAAKYWNHSSFHKWVRRGVYSLDWGEAEPVSLRGCDFE